MPGAGAPPPTAPRSCRCPPARPPGAEMTNSPVTSSSRNSPRETGLRGTSSPETGRPGTSSPRTGRPGTSSPETASSRTSSQVTSAQVTSDQGTRGLRLRVNPAACSGHGVCAELLPELITLDEWGYPLLAEGGVPAG